MPSIESLLYLCGFLVIVYVLSRLVGAIESHTAAVQMQSMALEVSLAPAIQANTAAMRDHCKALWEPPEDKEPWEKVGDEDE